MADFASIVEIALLVGVFIGLSSLSVLCHALPPATGVPLLKVVHVDCCLPATAFALAKGLAIGGPLPSRDRAGVALPDKLREEGAGDREISFAGQAID